jgi:hypothetical protein
METNPDKPTNMKSWNAKILAFYARNGQRYRVSPPSQFLVLIAAKTPLSCNQTAKAVMAIFNQRASVASALEDTDSIVQSLESGFAGGPQLSVGLFFQV